ILKDAENKCEQIIKLENEWRGLSKEVQIQESSAGEMVCIKTPLKKIEIDAIAAIIKTLEHNMEKTGFFANIKNFGGVSQLKKMLKLKNYDATYKNLNRLKTELETAELIYKLRKIESDI